LVERRRPGERSLLHELNSLAKTRGYDVVGQLEQVRPQASKFQIGSGKVEELAKLLKERGAQKVIFENELKTVQAYNLAKATGVEVISKFQLILEVFTDHALSNEAKLQVKLAKLRYELTKAREKVRLAKRGEQPGFHGLGKYEVNVYHEAIKRQVSHIEDELRRVRRDKTIRRSSRAELGFPTVSLSGYTAAGKSTLFNALTGKKAKVTEKLFTTLSTKISPVDFNGKKSLLIDTVGFIDSLPVTLIEAFRSTLEETVFSSLVILVVDCSEDLFEVRRKMKCCLDTLREIGVVTTPIITVLNKTDLIDQTKINEVMNKIKDLAPNPTHISALQRANLERLKETVFRSLKDFVKASFELPTNSDSLSLISKIRNFSTVLNQNYSKKSILIEVEAVDHLMDKIRSRVERLDGRMTSVKRI